MKKIILIAIISFSTFYYVNAQEVGLRFGYANYGNVAIDGIFGVGKLSRIHGDVSFGNNSVGIDALWDFINKPLGAEAFTWYAGVGPYMRIGDPFYLGVMGELGLEYHFNEVPIACGFDWRPGVSIVQSTNFFADSFGFNVRYVFGK